MTKQNAALDFSYAGVMPDASAVDHLVERSADIAVHIDEDSIIRGIFVNPDIPSIGCLDHWVGRPFVSFLTDESREKFDQRIGAIRQDPEAPLRPLELNHVDNAAWEFPVRYAPLRVAGSKALLLLGRDQQPIAEVHQRLITEQLARERDQQKLRGAETFYRVALEASETPLVVIDPASGRIRDINGAAANLLGAKPEILRGSAFNQSFEGRRRDELMDALQAASTPEQVHSVEAVTRRSGKTIAILPEYFRAAGELGLLCRMRALGDEEDGDGEMSRALNALFQTTADAIVVLDIKGQIRDANDSFLVLADAAQLRDLKGKPFSDFLLRGEVDLRMLLEGTRREGRMRSYSAQFRSIVGTRLQIDISTALLRPRGGDQCIGLIIREMAQRDLPAEDVSRMAVSEEAVKSVMDLVGTASLRELVSATSDVIERMCIDTALRMTNNNRVAAAEMLGLSRQSLYVKLRKYGLLGDNSAE